MGVFYTILTLLHYLCRHGKDMEMVRQKGQNNLADVEANRC